MPGRLLLVALGVGLALLVVETGMRAAGAVIRTAQARRNLEALRRGHDVRIACVGESTTEGDAEHGRYPEMLEEILNRQEIGVRVAVVNLGLSGAVTADLVGNIAEDLERVRPHLLVSMLGINDVGRTHAYGSIIAPGAGRWYGSLRLYKLYRVARFALARWWSGAGGAAELVLGEGIEQGRSPIDREAQGRWNDSHPPSAPRDPATLPKLETIRARFEARQMEGLEDELRGLIAAEPQFADLYVVLASVYRESDRAREAHAVLLEGVERSTGRSAGLHASLARSHFRRGEHERAFAILRQVLDGMLEPGNFGVRTHYMVSLAHLYESIGRYDDAERTLVDLVERVNPGNDIVYESLIEYYERRGQPDQVRRCRAIQRRIRYQYVNPVTRRNYKSLRETLAAQSVAMVAVQYPGRDVGALRLLLDDDPDVIYVDNSFFRRRAARVGYERLYYDNFAGDFGHLTNEGNCLLARNVARVIVERYFGLTFDATRAPCPLAAAVESPADSLG